jgi:hypothetical protein
MSLGNHNGLVHQETSLVFKEVVMHDMYSWPHNVSIIRSMKLIA